MGVQTDMGTSLAIRSEIPNCGKSVLLFLLACRLSQMLRKDMSILLCCACMQDGDVIDMIGNVEGYPTLEDLVNTAKTSENKDADIKSLLYNSSNIFFIDSSKATPLFVKNNTDGYLNLMECLKQQFDVIIIDTSSYSVNVLTKLMLKECDYILNVTVQD
jgi:cellulose biosynthesis protein BcsQ